MALNWRFSKQDRLLRETIHVLFKLDTFSIFNEDFKITFYAVAEPGCIEI